MIVRGSRWLSIGLAALMCACTAGRFRYDRLSERADNVELRDLEDLLRDEANTELLSAQNMTVERPQYDFTRERDEYRIGKNDVLNIFVLGHPELSSQRVDLGQISGTTVRKDGRIHLPVVGGIQAEGRTLTEFEQTLRETVARYIVDPQVSVEILRHESQKFYVLGSVPKPGAFAVDGDTTLVEGISLAGGIPPEADLSSATVVRNGQILPIDLVDVLRGGDLSRNVYLRHGDLIYVPDNVAKKVFVLGEVKHPTAVQIERDHVTLAEVLATAGGPTPAMARREIAVIRGGFAKPVVYRIDLDTALLVDHQIKLRAGDRVVVAPTGLATASRYMQQILPFLVGAQALGLAASGTSGLVNNAATLNTTLGN